MPTLPVTVDQMAYHTSAVVRGSERALVVADMPFMSYQASVTDGLRNAGRLMAETGCQAVKVEGAGQTLQVVSALVGAGIPAMGHLGLTPQSVHVFGGYRVQGREDGAADRLEAEALALQEAGAFAIVLEMVPGAVAARISAAVDVPTIGIGAGVGCDGQVLVCYDMLGMNEGFTPKFLKVYDDLGERVRAAAGRYVAEVKARTYPDASHTFE